ncbi:MAG: A/G-specific adenine glycosylase [Burkholderiaceae bacterium]
MSKRPGGAAETERFAGQLLRWARIHGRKDLPWQPLPGSPADPYRVWVSEIMLQQTQVQSVRGYFQRFIDRFPSLKALATADLQEVLAVWSGLGYYARARNLHRAAQQIVADWGGQFSDRAEDWQRLPGVGRSTAAAIVSICFGQREAILDANVRRVLARQVMAQEPWGSAALDQHLWQEAQDRLPTRPQDMPRYTQAMMDLGATVCLSRSPHCAACPVVGFCRAHAAGRVADFPVPRAKAPRPSRRAFWLLVVYQSRIGLWQRPPEGIWGGLWMPWDIPAAEPWPQGSKPLTMLRHGFTHFTLEVEVRLISPSTKARLLSLQRQSLGHGQALEFRPLAEFLALGLPAPVRRLLASSDLAG